MLDCRCLDLGIARYISLDIGKLGLRKQKVKQMRVLIVFCLTAGIVSSVSAAAQTAVAAPSSASGETTLKVTSRLTLVDVTVTDSKGLPVHGLTRADFTVKEDGKPQPLKNFEEYGTERPTTAPASPLPPNVYSNQLTSHPTTRAVNILLLDQVTIGLRPHPEALNAAKEASSQYLKTMPAGTRVAVLEMDGGGLHMVQGFTSDRDLLLAAVSSVTYKAVPDGRWQPPDTPAVSGLPAEKPNYLLLCNALNFQSARVLNALNQTAAFVSGVPGRKNLLWFTNGAPWLTDYERFSRSDALTALSDFTPQLQQIYGRLTTARVAVYPINPLGVWFEGNISGANGSLEDMAKATGGKPHFDNDMVGALREDTATGADYYALSYVPPLSKYDGKHHTIEVKVDRPGLQLEYRRGYTSLDLNGPLLETEKSHGKTAPPKDLFQTAMGYGAQPVNQVTFAVRALPSTGPRIPGVIGSLNAELKGKPLVRYSFAFDLPRNRITLVEQPDGTRKGSFEIAIAAYDVQGRMLNSLEEKRSFVLKPEMVAGFLQKPFLVPVDIDLPPGSVSVRAGVLDLPSEGIGVVEIPLTVMTP